LGGQLVRGHLVWLLVLLLAAGPAPAAGAETERADESTMEIVVAEWAYEVRDEGDYDPNPSGVFARGTRAYAYLEVEGFARGADVTQPLVDLRVDVGLRSRLGIKLFSQEDLVEYTMPHGPFPPDRVWFYIWVDIPWWAPRTTYVAEVTVRDLVAGGSVTLQREITVE